MNKEVNSHIKSIVNKTNFNRKQKKDFEEYLKCNFEEDYNNYISQNISPELALNKSLANLISPAEFSYEVDYCSVNKTNNNVQFIAISFLTLSILAVILANINHATFVDVLPYKFVDTFFNFFDLNLYTKISEVIELEQFFNVFSMTIFFLPIGFFLPLAMNRIYMEKYIIYSFIIITCTFEFSKILMMANPRLIYIILNFIVCLIGYIILRIFTLLFFKNTNKSQLTF